MKTVTVEKFLAFHPCCGEERVRAFAGDKRECTALDVLRADGVRAEEKLWAVLREDFLDAPLLHEFACRCAEEALGMSGRPDPGSVNAIACKRRWMRGEAMDEELGLGVNQMANRKKGSQSEPRSEDRHEGPSAAPKPPRRPGEGGGRKRVTPRTIRAWEAGAQAPGKANLSAISKGYELPIDLAQRAWSTISRAEYYRVRESGGTI